MYQNNKYKSASSNYRGSSTGNGYRGGSSRPSNGGSSFSRDSIRGSSDSSPQPTFTNRLRNQSNSSNSFSNPSRSQNSRSGGYQGSYNNRGSNSYSSAPSKPRYFAKNASPESNERPRSSYNRFSSSSNRGSQFGGQRGRRNTKSFMDINMFVKKAVDAPIIEEQIAQKTFADFPLSNPLKQNIIARGYTTPTPIQNQAIEPILEGRDLIGLANTGTGKTAAFLLPLIDKVFTKRQDRVIIIVPTRELAVQINDELRSFNEGMRIYSALVIGGANMHRQIYDLRRNPHFVIGTPGRLKDLIQHKHLSLQDFSIFVLDEVDLMVDIGFIEDIKHFVSMLPKVRQSLFFSATISPKIRGILDQFVVDPVTASVKPNTTTENNIEQDVVRVPDKNKKVDVLHDLLIKDGFDKVLIFGRTKHGVEHLNKELSTRGFKVGSIHGNKSQGARQRTLKSFKQNEIQVLLATDVASRGLDIDNVTHVINYELPETYEDYIHRIGRTGRANKKGTALTFID